MACILWSSAVRVHDSEAHRKMGVTRERISRILELREVLLSLETGFNLVNALTTICNKIWQTGEWPTPWTQSFVITLSKKGNLKQCQNCRTISLISHPNKVMLKVVLNRLKPQAEKIIAEEQAGFRAGRSTTEQIFNLRILCENIFSTSKTSTMSSWTSIRPSTGFGMQLCWQQ